MSNNIQLHRKETKDKFDTYATDDFFENEENLEKFSQEQKQQLFDRLVRYGYAVETEKENETTFGFKNDKTVRALLTENGLYLTASGVDGIFEINMTASEFTDTGEFLKYDPQDAEWEEPM
ncbi:hypothetical protein IQ05_03221 [Flavobacterium tiangeerense]|uniref:Uncharacterized protein n=1 Tax=Flavobacterium tiangeerense TaxID=459471 RepID=A0ABY3FJC3_9FLAO|nr:hypothetical protein [Flavobacterium tiangeerense]TWH98765.1 hypothetical protein IQ05_03221 [Flavobacterium tiangeerense]